MSRVGATISSLGRWREHLRGHFLLFEPQPLLVHTRAVGLRLLLLAMGLEILRVFLVRGRSPLLPLWTLVPLLLGAAVMLVPLVAGVSLSQLGLSALERVDNHREVVLLAGAAPGWRPAPAGASGGAANERGADSGSGRWCSCPTSSSASIRNSS